MFCCACDRLGVPRPIACENEYSLVNRTYESQTWEAAYRFGLVGLPYGVLSGGVLTGKCTRAAPCRAATCARRPVCAPPRVTYVTYM